MARRSLKLGPLRLTVTHKGVSPSFSTGGKGRPGISVTKRGTFLRLGGGSRLRLR